MSSSDGRGPVSPKNNLPSEQDSRPTVSRIERAATDVGVEVVQRIADALGVAVSELFVPAARIAWMMAKSPRGSMAETTIPQPRAVLEAVYEAAEREIDATAVPADRPWTVKLHPKVAKTIAATAAKTPRRSGEKSAI